MAKVLKQLLASQLRKAVHGSEGAIFVNLGPMTVEQNMKLRGFLRQKAGGARLRVLHNRTARVALKEAGYPAKVDSILKGPTAAIFGGDGTGTDETEALASPRPATRRGRTAGGDRDP